jgi:hypothetical protein
VVTLLLKSISGEINKKDVENLSEPKKIVMSQFFFKRVLLLLLNKIRKMFKRLAFQPKRRTWV